MSQKTLKIFLVLSLAANLLVAGAVGSFFGSGRHKDLRLDNLGSSQKVVVPDRISSLGSLLRAMERKDQRDFGRMIQEALDESGGMAQDARQAIKTDLAMAVRATPFDGDAVLALIEVDSSKLSRRLKLVRQVLVKKLATMTPDARAKLAQSLLTGQK